MHFLLPNAYPGLLGAVQLSRSELGDMHSLHCSPVRLSQAVGQLHAAPISWVSLVSPFVTLSDKEAAAMTPDVAGKHKTQPCFCAEGR